MFTDVTDTVLPIGANERATFELRDMDFDGDLDLVQLDGGTLFLHENVGGVFANDLGQEVADNSEGAFLIEDFDADGDWDLVVHDGERTRFLRSLVRQLRAPLPPVLGRNYEIEVRVHHTLAQGTETVLPMLAFGEVRPPVHLSPLGAFRLAGHPTVPLSKFAIDPASGKGSTTIVIPDSPELADIPFVLQAVVQHDADPATWRLTHAVPERVVR